MCAQVEYEKLWVRIRLQVRKCKVGALQVSKDPAPEGPECHAGGAGAGLSRERGLSLPRTESDRNFEVILQKPALSATFLYSPQYLAPDWAKIRG